MGVAACRIYHFMAGVTGPIYDCHHCRTGDIAKTQVKHTRTTQLFSFNTLIYTKKITLCFAENIVA